METLIHQFTEGIKQTHWLEYLAVLSGIASVWYSKKENILVYPVGLLNTLIYIYLSLKGDLYGEASVNIYYSVMSIYGWIVWSKRDAKNRKLVQVRFSSATEWLHQLFFFAFFYVVLYAALLFLKQTFAPEAIPMVDALASASAFTGMWLMTRKKLESWYWWILTNITSIPLYFVKGYMFTSVYYLILLIIAFFGLAEWGKKAMSRS
jgi:nicotinamide mononucleotide transporter